MASWTYFSKIYKAAVVVKQLTLVQTPTARTVRAHTRPHADVPQAACVRQIPRRPPLGT